MRRLLRLCAFTLGSLAALVTDAGAGSYDSSDPYHRYRAPNEKGAFTYDDSGDKVWSEEKVRIPAPPASEEGFLELQLESLPREFRAYIDPGAVDLNPNDRVLRYWLIVRSGASTTVSYEGANCASRELKVYAFADPRGPDGLRRVRDPRWQPVGFGRRNDYHWELFDSVLCSGSSPRDQRGITAAAKGYYERTRPMSEYSENLRPPLP